jgi:hypothetical protein
MEPNEYIERKCPECEEPTIHLSGNFGERRYCEECNVTYDVIDDELIIRRRL